MPSQNMPILWPPDKARTPLLVAILLTYRKQYKQKVDVTRTSKVKLLKKLPYDVSATGSVPGYFPK